MDTGSIFCCQWYLYYNLNRMLVFSVPNSFLIIVHIHFNLFNLFFFLFIIDCRICYLFIFHHSLFYCFPSILSVYKKLKDKNNNWTEKEKKPRNSDQTIVNFDCSNRHFSSFHDDARKKFAFPQKFLFFFQLSMQFAMFRLLITETLRLFKEKTVFFFFYLIFFQ